jgi:2-amino-4-hydroxy-6-hydroxymethyldihydropteridine diphosphokinase
LPREEILYNAFVLLPLAELAPNEVHPQSGATYQQLWNDYDKASQNLWKIPFDWQGKKL